MNPRKALSVTAVAVVLLGLLNELFGTQEWRTVVYVALGMLISCLGLAVDAIGKNAVRLPEAPVAVPDVHVVRPEDRVIVTLDADAFPQDIVGRIANELHRQFGDDGFLVIQSPGMRADVEPRNQED